MTRNASGTWSSERVAAISAAAEYFCPERTTTVTFSIRNITFIKTSLYDSKHLPQACRGSPCTHPKSPETKHHDDEVHHVGEEHQSVDVGGGSVLGVQDVLDERVSWFIDPVDAGTPEGREREKEREMQVKHCVER